MKISNEVAEATRAYLKGDQGQYAWLEGQRWPFVHALLDQLARATSLPPEAFEREVVSRLPNFSEKTIHDVLRNSTGNTRQALLSIDGNGIICINENSLN